MAYKGKGGFAIRQEGLDYFITILRHIDSMSDGLKEGIEVGKINTKHLVGYYQQIIHLEGLLVPFLTKEFYEKRAELEENLPGYSSTWSGSFGNQVDYFIKISDLFQLLILFAYKTGVLKIKRTADYKIDNDIL